MINNFYRRALKVSLNSVVNNVFISNNSIINTRVPHQCAFASNVLGENKPESSTTKSPDKKVYITLIGTDGIPKTSTLEAAQKLSKRRDLRLIKVSDYDSRRETPVYKLLTGQQVLGEEISHKKQNKGKTGFKSEKIVSFSHNISEHDLHSKTQQILKWLQKKHEVRATITGSSDNSLAESVFHKIEGAVKDTGRILQKRSSGSDIKFQIIPLKENKKEKGADEKMAA